MLHTDNFQQRLPIGIARNRTGFGPAKPAALDVVVGYVRVAGEPVPGGDFDVMSLRDRLSDVPPFLRPVPDDELQVPPAESSERHVPAGSFRTRVVSYFGYGPTDFPVIEENLSFVDRDPLLGQVYPDFRLEVPELKD